MKNIIRHFLVAICLFININLLHSQWVKSNFPTTYGEITSLAVIGTNLFAATQGAGVFLSTDNGTTWIKADSGLTLTYSNVTSLSVSGTNLFAVTGGLGGLYVSTNNGKSWATADSGLTNTEVTSLAVSGTNFYAGTCGSGWGPGGVYLSTNNGRSWTPVDTNLTIQGQGGINCLAVASNEDGGTNLFAGTYLNGVLLSTNNGTNWSAVNSGLQYDNPYYPCVYALAVSGTNLFAGTGGIGYTPGRLYLSTNNGKSWTADSSDFPIADKVDAFAVTPNGAGGTNIFAGIMGVWPRANSTVFLSTNNGTSWMADGLQSYNIGSPYSFANVSSFAVLPNGTGDTNLFAGTDYGIWQRSLSKIIPAITLNQYAFEFFLYSLPPLGIIDTLRITNSSLAPLVIDSVYTKTKWFTVVSLHDTVTERDTVSFLVSFTPDTRGKLYSDTLYIVSNSIYSLTKVPLSGEIKITGVSQNHSDIPKNYGISQNYPNPFNPTTIINYQLPVNSFVTLKVYDILGREVEVLVNEMHNAGNYTVTFNADKLSCGVYFYRLQAGTYSETKKLLLLK